jgi:hypothetical protein
VLARLLILLALGAPVHADDPIAQWLKQDESDGQNEQVRPDLHALTDQELQDIFKVGREQVDGHQLIERGSEEHPRVLYIWLVTLAAGFGAVIGAFKAAPFVRRQLRTLALPVSRSNDNTPELYGSAAQTFTPSNRILLKILRKRFVF